MRRTGRAGVEMVHLAVGVLGLAIILCWGLCCGAFAEDQPNAARSADTSDVRIVSSFVAAGEPVPEECREEAHAFAQLLVRYPRPLSWHWVLVCDQPGWEKFLRLSGRREADRIYASTDLEARTSYLRGPKLLNSGEFGVCPDEIVAHELAHIWLHSGDEAAADTLAHLWLQSPYRQTLHWVDGGRPGN